MMSHSFVGLFRGAFFELFPPGGGTYSFFEFCIVVECS